MNPELKFYREVRAAAEAEREDEEVRFQRILRGEDKRDKEQRATQGGWGPMGKRSSKVSYFQNLK